MKFMLIGHNFRVCELPLQCSHQWKAVMEELFPSLIHYIKRCLEALVAVNKHLIFYPSGK